MRKQISVIKFFLFLTLFFGSLWANDFRDTTEVSLQKDEQKKILVKYDSYERLFKFRWTLYKNGGLVIHIDRQFESPTEENDHVSEQDIPCLIGDRVISGNCSIEEEFFSALNSVEETFGVHYEF